jgi:hypothetical protein
MDEAARFLVIDLPWRHRDPRGLGHSTNHAFNEQLLNGSTRETTHLTEVSSLPKWRIVPALPSVCRATPGNGRSPGTTFASFPWSGLFLRRMAQTPSEKAASC